MVIARIETLAAARLGEVFRPSLQRVINATGVIIHTNLGRAPLAPVAIDRLAEIARGYATLEYDVARGERGRRDIHAEALLCRLTGAEAAVIVNNNAAATMLVLAALASGREVVVSRGELVEIGGGFRVPDVMAQSGAVLREVGTTNKTRVSDYAGDKRRTADSARPPLNSGSRVYRARRYPTSDRVGRRMGVRLQRISAGHLAGFHRAPSGSGHPMDRRETAVEPRSSRVGKCAASRGRQVLGGAVSIIIGGRHPRTHPRHPPCERAA